MTHREVYEDIYTKTKETMIHVGFSEDSASKRANIQAVKFTNIVYHDLKKNGEEFHVQMISKYEN